jgi:hypothetical protein
VPKARLAGQWPALIRCAAWDLFAWLPASPSWLGLRKRRNNKRKSMLPLAVAHCGWTFARAQPRRLSRMGHSGAAKTNWPPAVSAKRSGRAASVPNVNDDADKAGETGFAYTLGLAGWLAGWLAGGRLAGAADQQRDGRAGPRQWSVLRPRAGCVQKMCVCRTERKANLLVQLDLVWRRPRRRRNSRQILDGRHAARRRRTVSMTTASGARCISGREVAAGPTATQQVVRASRLLSVRASAESAQAHQPVCK